MRFEWDEEKNQINIEKHGISFQIAARIFLSPYYEIYDEKHSGVNRYGEIEDRYIALGWVEEVLYVAYTIRIHSVEETIRLISARPANDKEKLYYLQWLSLEEE